MTSAPSVQASSTPAVSTARLLSARRWMTAGLIVSILGTRLVEGGSDGLVALGVLPLLWVSVLTTFGELVSFASPLIARLTARFSPARVLVASDLAEALLSGVALVALLTVPGGTLPVLIVYLLLAAVFPAVTDVVEEFYGQQLAQVDVKQALTFNASVYSALAFVGIVIAMPLGNLLAGVSITVLIAGNLVLSALGTLLRLVSSRTVVTAPAIDQDLEDFGVLGERMTVRAFLRDLWATGAASPLFSFLLQVGGTIGGVFVYLAIAQKAPVDPSVALASVIAMFGIGATIGPWVGRALSSRGDIRRLVWLVLVATVAFLLVVAGLLSVVDAAALWWTGLAYALVLGILSRTRAVLTTTLRQQDYRGTRFARIMSWSFAATALGAVAGSWLALGLKPTQHPSLALLVQAGFIVLALVLLAVRVPTDSAPENAPAR
ncbi:MFS transporter [Arthrobacter sp. Y-9]|uniref:MFS transporter n=1 Tax=Arthrobacter sp. Y-9 TaxID=3039385 RepID=UPI00241DE925|nr:MFS transporter [Arthrobacter sp. Y-9]WFR84315.1 MFS transporter [Arthrobacter sp. Y-9]